ncbi:glycoside hydrolase family 65 protein [Nocardia blacklockiae]|uniref:glycoside hydrolase family 65 protein n=1 Tax=Nocardia blacklockiae TaxID=480036 RepID=UPI0018935001|nr:glycoside hydrolase family 65 protein [Nocardia blacklockiae]MBF6176613.1 glycoside hydrolase family 65 protein [Nocardia blacklockiae]
MNGDADPGDPRWTIRQQPTRPRVSDAPVFTVGEAGFATRGVSEESVREASGVLSGGVYTGAGEFQHLLEGPVWTRLRLRPPTVSTETVLDLYRGVLCRTETADGGRFRSLRFGCADRPGVFAMRAVAEAGRIQPEPPLSAPAPDSGVEVSAPPEPRSLAADETACVRTASPDGAVTAVAADRYTHGGLNRVAAYAIDGKDGAGASRAERALARAWERGLDGLLGAHQAVWRRRWSAVGIELPDDPDTELAVRFALFALWCNAGAHGESAVGARGLSGTGYRGHVFWDADAFVLPALVTLDPAAAAAMVSYRLRRLPAARARAAAAGCRGARFPWESAAEGTDVTPGTGFLGGTPVPIRTGAQEEHITADVAWAACRYAEWCGVPGYLETTARPLLVETARYWASRVSVDAHGRAHLLGVIGPDEYHESVDDNAYTNVMARWNLRRAARLTPETDSEAEEFAEWVDLAERMVDQLGPDGRYEQFRGYDELEPLSAASFAPLPVAADVLLGQARVAGSQLIKQPDVLMLHHLVPEETAPGSLAVNLDYYAPRTTHGSSLSPAVMASLSARAGRPDEALEMLSAASRLDLDDRTATTASGLHLANLAGVWQAVLSGFAGIEVRGGVLSVRPMLPARWSRLGLAFRCLGRRIRLDIGPNAVTVRADGPVVVAIGDHPPAVACGETRWPTGDKEER